MASEDFCLRWEEGKNPIFVGPWSCTFNDLKNDEDFCDITLITEEGEIKCHKFILAACSSHFRNIIKRLKSVSHPCIYMRGVKHVDLEKLVHFMYLGEVSTFSRFQRLFLIFWQARKTIFAIFVKISRTGHREKITGIHSHMFCQKT